MEQDKITTDHWMYKLACMPCDKLREKKIDLKGSESKPLLSLTAIILAIFLLFKKE